MGTGADPALCPRAAAPGERLPMRSGRPVVCRESRGSRDPHHRRAHPTNDSPKCPRCSLVGICLPDEHNNLTGRSQRSPRRVTPTDGSARPLYVTEPGARIGVRAGRVEVTLRERRLASVRRLDFSQLCVFGNVQVTTQARLFGIASKLRSRSASSRAADGSLVSRRSLSRRARRRKSDRHGQDPQLPHAASAQCKGTIVRGKGPPRAGVEGDERWCNTPRRSRWLAVWR